MNNEELILDQPQIASIYINIYFNLWRGQRSKYLQSVYLNQMLDFCEKYTDLLLSPNYRNLNIFDFRSQFKSILIQMEEDVKIDANDSKRRIKELMHVDPDLMTEDLKKRRQDVIENEIEREAIISNIVEKIESRKLWRVKH